MLKLKTGLPGRLVNIKAPVMEAIMKKIHPSEKGQIVIFLALALLGMLAITALALDGGMLYSDQRYSQSTADAASLAGGGAVAASINDLDLLEGYWDCGLLGTAISNGYDAAIQKAAANGYTISRDPALGIDAHDHGVLITCSNAGQYVDVDVMLTKETKTSFVQLFNYDNKDMKTTVFSKTRAKPRRVGDGGASIVSLSHLSATNTDDCGSKQGGVWFSGTNKTTLLNGGVYSNSCVDKNSGASTVGMTNADVTYHVGSYSAGITDPTPKSSASYHPLTYDPMPFPDELCSASDDTLTDFGSVSFSTGGEQTLTSGKYHDWDFKVPVKLTPGLYCISGSVSMNAAAYVYTDTVMGADGKMPGVTIYFNGDSLTLNGGSDTALVSPTGYTNPEEVPNHAINNLLLYIPPGNDADVVINGNSNNTLVGTLYMPDANVKINGAATAGSASTFECSIIGYWVTVTGASDINIVYNAKKQWSWPSYIQLQK